MKKPTEYDYLELQEEERIMTKAILKIAAALSAAGLVVWGGNKIRKQICVRRFLEA